jgi:hypothetical protein
VAAALKGGNETLAFTVVALSDINDDCIGIHVASGREFLGSQDFVRALLMRPSKGAVIVIEGQAKKPVHEIEDFVAAQVEGPDAPHRCILILGRRLRVMDQQPANLSPDCLMFQELDDGNDKT